MKLKNPNEYKFGIERIDDNHIIVNPVNFRFIIDKDDLEVHVEEQLIIIDNIVSVKFIFDKEETEAEFRYKKMYDNTKGFNYENSIDYYKIELKYNNNMIQYINVGFRLCLRDVTDYYGIFCLGYENSYKNYEKFIEFYKDYIANKNKSKQIEWE